MAILSEQEIGKVNILLLLLFSTVEEKQGVWGEEGWEEIR
jgi:hypothetical protein